VVLCPDIDEMAPYLHAAFGSEAAMPCPHPYAWPTAHCDRPIPCSAQYPSSSHWSIPADVSQVLAFAALAPVRERFALDATIACGLDSTSH